jgi:hypothetical protein
MKQTGSTAQSDNSTQSIATLKFDSSPSTMPLYSPPSESFRSLHDNDKEPTNAGSGKEIPCTQHPHNALEQTPERDASIDELFGTED